ncbi:MAG: hypothetical protein R3F02_09975 [Thiolinea sp.]
MNNKTELELLNKVRQGLTEQCDKLPEQTVSRLRTIRGIVQKKAVVPQRFYHQTVLGVPFTPVAATLSAGILGVVLLMMSGSPVKKYTAETAGIGETGNIVDVVDDVDVLMSNEDMEFLENLEIYEWLDAEYG